MVLRTSIVLDRGTPALDRLTWLVRLGLGGRVGSGRQWFSWIHVEDWLATAPHPVRNAELMATLRRVLHRPPAPPTPVPLIRLGALLLRTDPALGLTGRRAIPGRLAAAGFEFVHPRLEGALADLFRRP